jgi:hypothetical protein
MHKIIPQVQIMPGRSKTIGYSRILFEYTKQFGTEIFWYKKKFMA